MRTADFDFELPAAAIAQHPRARGSSRLLVLDRTGGAHQDRMFAALPDLLRPGDLLVVNDTRVFPARLTAERQDGRMVELLLVRERAPGEWEALAKPGRRARAGDRLQVAGEPLEVTATLPGGSRVLRFASTDVLGLAEAHGQTPLPPYIKRPASDLDERDREYYQTVYARERGSVAAPTAGIHFTAELFAALAARGIERAPLTLHVGTGTFKPVKSDDVHDHVMDPEWYTIPASTVAALAVARSAGRRIVAVGTTSVRALESAASSLDKAAEPPQEISGETRLFVTPGYHFRWTDALITNFHLPRSTLLMLVAAFAGREHALAAYEHAIAAGYLFYSYGDAMLVQ